MPFPYRRIILIVLPIILAVSGFVFGWLTRDVKLGLTWMLILGFGGLFGELIALGVWDGLHTQNWKNRKLWAGILLIIIVMSGIGYLIYIGILGSIFGQPAPPEVPTGWAKIRAYDPINRNYVNGKVYVFSYENNTNWLNTTTDTTFLLLNMSYALVDCGIDYYNTSIGVNGSGCEDCSTVQINTVYVFKKANDNDVQMELTSLDGTPGNYKATDITDGHHTLILTISIIGNSQGTSVFGVFAYIPPTWRNETFAYQNGIYGEGGWIGWNGTVSNIKYWGVVEPVYNVSSYNIEGIGVNATYVFIDYDVDIVIEADFQNMRNITLYYGFLDDWRHYIEIL